MNNILNEIDVVARRAGISAEQIKHVIINRSDVAFIDTDSGPLFTIDIPPGRLLLITGDFEISSYPTDAAGSHLFSERQKWAFADQLSLWWKHDNVSVSLEGVSYKRLIRGISLFRPGRLVLHAEYDGIPAAATNQRISLSVSGYFVPEEAAARLESLETIWLTTT